MSYVQLLTPNPNIPCEEGMCLQYVRQTFGVSRIVYGRAIDAWQGSASQHPDWNFPVDCAVPVYFTLEGIPAGHVALHLPDGSVWSSSDLGTVPHHHPSMADLLAYYAYYGKPLTYLGWTEDIENTSVITSDGSINFQSITPTEEDPLANFTFDDLVNAAAQGALKALETQVTDGEGVQTSALDVARIIRPLVHDVPNQVMKLPVARGGKNVSGNSSLAGVVAYFDQTRTDLQNTIPGAVLNQQFTLADGTVTNLVGILAAINAKPVTGGTVTTDPAAIEAAILAVNRTQWNK